MAHPSESPSALPTASAPNQTRAVNGKEQRERAVQKLEAQALENPDPLQAILGFLTGDMVRLTSHLGDSLEERQQNRERTNGQPNEAVYRDIDVYLKSMRQTD